MTYDNGLSKAMQKIVDARYEELMAQLKEINPKEHKKMMEEIANPGVVFKEETDQLELSL